MSPAVLHSLLFGTASAMAGVMTFAKADPFKRKGSAWIISFILLEAGCFLNMYSVNSSGSPTLLMIGGFANWASYFIIDRAFAEKPSYFNLVIVMMLQQVNTLVLYIVIRPMPEIFYVMSTYKAENVVDHLPECLFGIGIFLVGTWICLTIYARLFRRKREHNERVFMIICAILSVYVVCSYLIKVDVLRTDNRWVIGRLFMTSLMAFASVVFAITVTERVRVKREQEEKRKTLELLDRNYKEAVEKNKELRKIKHDLNKELQVIKLLAENGQNTEARSGMLDLLAKHSEYAELSFSGDAKFDMFISLIFREADDRGIILEHIIEQSRENIEAIDRYTSVLKKVIDELMDRSSRQYRRKNRSEQDEHSKQQGQSKHQRQSGKNIDDKPWMRITCRRKGRHTLFNVEYSIPQSEINRRKIISLITITRANELKSEQMLDSSIVSDGGNYYVEEADGRGLLSIMFD